MNNILVDTNIIIRFLTNDDEVQSLIAFQIFEKAIRREINMIISPMIIAECTWVLQMKRYGYSKQEIADKLNQIITAPGITTLEKELTLKALADYSTHNVDFIDAYLAATSTFGEYKQILTWNKKDFERLGCEYYTPEELCL